MVGKRWICAIARHQGHLSWNAESPLQQRYQASRINYSWDSSDAQKEVWDFQTRWIILLLFTGI